MTTNDSTTILNTKLRDSNSKIIFDEPILCAQFLRDYIEDIPLLKNVRPEDIVDVSEQYVHLFSEERNSDRVKKVQIKNGTPFFLVSLIEHKTKVEYNVTMQIFRYMIYIWEAYEREEEKQKKGISKQKGFRYPPILPIVYYEGRQEWTVPLDFKSRIIEGDTFAKYVPDFRYYLVPLRKYSDRLPKEQLDAILKDTPEHIVDIIADMLLAFLLKSNVSANEAEKVVGKVKEKNMGQLFADMEPIDIQAEQAKIRIQKKEIEVERQEIQVERQEIQREQQEIQVERQEIQSERQEIQREQQEIQVQRQKIQSERQKLDAQKRELELMRQKILAEKNDL